MSDLAGRVALVTGAARGLGQALCVCLAEEGVDIVGVDIGRQIATVDYPMPAAEALEGTRSLVEAAGSTMRAVQADVRDATSMQAAVDGCVRQFGRLDIVLANAAIAPLRGPAGEEEGTWHDVIDVNLTGAWNTVHAALPAVIAGGRGGSVVFTNSTAGLRGLGGGTVAFCAYTAAKHALLGFSKAVALETGDVDITSNTICPAYIRTPLVDAQIAEQARTHQIPEEEVIQRIMLEPMPKKAFITIEEVAAAIEYLISPFARNITGQTLTIDGGWTAR